MSITLQSTVGGFSAEFMRKLPALEQAMIAHGLEPSEFVISKDRATPSPRCRSSGRFSTTTRCSSARTVSPSPSRTTSNSWNYFHQRCIDEDEPTTDSRAAAPPGLINRFFRWMTQPI